MKNILSCIYLQGYTVRDCNMEQPTFIQNQSHSNPILSSSGQVQQVQVVQELPDGQLVQRPLTIDGVNVRRAIY